MMIIILFIRAAVRRKNERHKFSILPPISSNDVLEVCILFEKLYPSMNRRYFDIVPQRCYISETTITLDIIISVENRP